MKQHLIVFFLFFLVCAGSVDGQTIEEINALEKSVTKLYGLEKLKALNQLTAYYINHSGKKAVRYGRQAETLAESIFSFSNVLVDSEDRFYKYEAHYQLGQAYYDQNKFDKAKKSMAKARQETNYLDDRSLFTRADRFLANIDSANTSNENFFKKKMSSLKIGDKLSSTSLDIRISAIKKLAREYEKSEKYEKAIQQYEKAANLSMNAGKAEQVADLHLKIADLNKKVGNVEEAVAFYEITASEFEKLGDTVSVRKSNEGLVQVFNDFKTEEPTYIAPPDIELPDSSKTEVKKVIIRYKELAEEFAEREDYDQSLRYYKLYAELEAQLREEEQKQIVDSIELQNRAQQIQLLAKDNSLSEIQLHQKNIELRRQVRFRQGITYGAIPIILLAGLFYWLFISKKRAHKQLQVTYNNLEETQDQLSQAEKKIKKLLGQQVSSEVAQALMTENDAGSTSKFVCVMFLDIRDFTPFAEKRQPQEIIQYQNDVFGFMIEIVDKYNGVINQFMGDGFMATFGAPISHGNDVANAYKAAVEIVEEVNQRSQSKTIYPTRVGIGLHAGNVVTGNVGTEIRKQYSITGNTVITAARIEQLNKKHNTQLLISESVAKHLNGELKDRTDFVEEKLKGREKPTKIYKVV